MNAAMKALYERLLNHIQDGEECDWFENEADNWAPCNQLAQDMEDEEWERHYGNSKKPTEPCSYCRDMEAIQDYDAALRSPASAMGEMWEAMRAVVEAAKQWGVVERPVAADSHDVHEEALLAALARLDAVRKETP